MEVKIKKLLLILTLAVFSSSANAAMVLIGVFAGENDPALDTSFVSGEAGVTLFHDDRINWDSTTVDGDGVTVLFPVQTSGGLTITGTVFNDPFDAGEITAFDWSISGAADYITFKTDGWLALFQLTDGTTSGSLDLAVLAADTDCCSNVGNGSIQALSHSATYSVVPVPAAVWLFATGLVGLIGVARRKA